jgi:hypothetical protein
MVFQLSRHKSRSSLVVLSRGPEYLHCNLDEAQSILFRTSFFTSPAEAAPTTAELIGQSRVQAKVPRDLGSDRRR